MTIKIQLIHEYHIVDDSYQFKVIRRKANDTGGITEVTISYSSTLGSAVKKIIREETGTSEEITTISEYAKKVDDLFKEIHRQLTERPDEKNARTVSKEIVEKAKESRKKSQEVKEKNPEPSDDEYEF